MGTCLALESLNPDMELLELDHGAGAVALLVGKLPLQFSNLSIIVNK
jgi:3-hydroxy-3-methylglutaryl CoA synthase